MLDALRSCDVAAGPASWNKRGKRRVRQTARSTAAASDVEKPQLTVPALLRDEFIFQEGRPDGRTLPRSLGGPAGNWARKPHNGRGAPAPVWIDIFWGSLRPLGASCAMLAVATPAVVQRR